LLFRGKFLVASTPIAREQASKLDFQAKRLKRAVIRASFACVPLLGGLVVRGLPDSTHSLVQEEDLPLLLGRSPEAFDSLLQ